jgi:cell wall-associated NlpC family hydrolase
MSTTCLPYFRTADRVQVLLNQLHLWSGTRWRHAGVRPNEMRCGVSGDCLFWVHVFKAIGALPEKLEIPDYRRQEALADEMQTLRRCIEATGHAELTFESAQAKHPPIFHVGDVLLFKNGTSGAHCGLVVKDAPVHFVHLAGNGLLEEPFHQSHYLAALLYVYRLLETEVLL